MATEAQARERESLAMGRLRKVMEVSEAEALCRPRVWFIAFCLCAKKETPASSPKTNTWQYFCDTGPVPFFHHAPSKVRLCLYLFPLLPHPERVLRMNSMRSIQRPLPPFYVYMFRKPSSCLGINRLACCTECSVDDGFVSLVGTSIFVLTRAIYHVLCCMYTGVRQNTTS